MQLQYIDDFEGIHVGFLQTTDMCELYIYFILNFLFYVVTTNAACTRVLPTITTWSGLGEQYVLAYPVLLPKARLEFTFYFVNQRVALYLLCVNCTQYY